MVVESFEMSEVFAQDLSTVCVTDNPSSPAILLIFPGKMQKSVTAVDNFALTLLSLNSNSLSNPDVAHPLILKSRYSESAYPLSVVFNESLLSGSIILLWSKSLVAPLFILVLASFL